MTLKSLKIWDSQLAYVTAREVFIIWEPLSSRFLRVNFDCSVSNRSDGAGFMIRDYTSRLVATRRVISSIHPFLLQSFRLRGLRLFMHIGLSISIIYS